MQSRFLLLLSIYILTTIYKLSAVSIFTGSISNEWNHPMNWQPQLVPTINDDVIIPSSYTGVIDINGANASCKNLLYQGNQLLLVVHAGWRLIIGGNFEIQGNSTVTGTGMIEFNGSQQSNIMLSPNAVLNIGTIEIKKQGSVHLTHDLLVPNTSLRILSGTLRTMGYTLDAYSIAIDQSTLNKSFQCQNSQIYCNRLILYLNQSSSINAYLSNIYIREFLYQNGTGHLHNVTFENGAEFILDGMMTYTYVNLLKAQGDISLIGTKNSTAKRFYIQVLEMQADNAICKMTEVPYVDFYQIVNFQLQVSCSSNYIFSDFNEVNASQINIRLNGNIVLSRASFANTKIQSGTLQVSEGFNLGNNSNIQFISQPIKTMYWVGGQGEWNDGNHWAFTSGGQPSGCIPDFYTDVIIDDFSGLSTTDTIKVLNHGFVNNLYFISSTVKPVFFLNSKGALNIRGSLDFSGLSSFIQKKTICFYATGNNFIRTNNLLFNEDVFFYTSGTWNILGYFNLDNGNKSIYHLNGRIITNGFKIKASSYVSRPAKMPFSNRFLNIENSELEIGDVLLKPGLLTINSTNYVLNAANSTIAYNYSLNQIPVFEISGQNDLLFNVLKFNHPISKAQLRLNGKCAFHKIECNSDIEFLGLPVQSLISSSRVDSLILFGGFTTTFESSKFITVLNGIFVNSGVCEELSYIKSSHPLQRARIHYLGNNNDTISYLICQGIEISGNSPVNIINGVDHLNNDGLLFHNQAIGKIFYWNGEAGDAYWGNGQNWNINIEPHAGLGNDLNALYNPNGCKPGFIDSVVFHFNSFPVNDTVCVNINCSFKGMNWLPGTGLGKVITGMPYYSLNNFGGLRFDNSITFLFQGTFRFLTNDSRTIQTNNNLLSGRIQFAGYGTYRLLDGINAPVSNVEIYSGSFITNNHPITSKHLLVDMLPVSGLTFSFLSGNSLITTHQNALFSFYEGYHQVDMQGTYLNFPGPAAKLTLKGNKNNFHIKSINFSSTLGTALYNSTYYQNPVLVNDLRFNANGILLGNNIYDSLVFSEGRVYEFEFNTTHTINHFLYSKGSPCYRTTIQSNRPGFKAFISHPDCNLSINHARLRDLEAVNNCILLNYKVNIGSEDLGNNSNWIFVPGDPINGLGNDTTIGCNDLPFEVTTHGFGVYNSLIWDNGFNDSIYQVTRSDTLTVYVTYSPSCVVYDTRKIFLNNSIHHTYSIDSITCYDANNASIIVSVLGGNGDYWGYWQSNQPYQILNDSIISQLTPGLYQHITYQVDFEEICSDTLTVLITQPDSMIILPVITPISCHNQNDASITINVMGGNGGCNFTWQHDSTITTNTLLNLGEGSFQVQVTDRKGCVAESEIHLYNPAPLIVNYEILPATCGLADGIAELHVQGGTTPYQFFWSHNSLNADSISIDIPYGSHFAIVKDANLCSDTVYFDIEQNNLITAIYELTNVSCFGGSDGKISIHATGGTGVYTYNIINYQNNLWADSIIENLSAGEYVIQIQDSNSCIATDTVVITQPNEIILSQINTTLPKCYGNTDGAIEINVSGGVGNYIIYWPELDMYGSTINNLPADNYSVIVSDINGCVKHFDILLEQPDSLVLFVDKIKHISCFEYNDGLVVLKAYGGTPLYYLNNFSSNNEFIVNSLSPGTFNFLIEDANGCVANAHATINQPQPLRLLIDSVLPGKCNVAEGYIKVLAEGGTPFYQYIWDNGQNINENSFAINGLNTVTVIDNNGCSNQIEIELDCISQLYIPQLVTPNGDNFSEQWVIHDLYRLYPNNHVQIFNRLGSLVFDYHGYSDQFKGISNTNFTPGNGLLPESTYYYVIDLGNNWGRLTGFIELDY